MRTTQESRHPPSIRGSGAESDSSLGNLPRGEHSDSARWHARERGLTLIEVTMALCVLTIGLLSHAAVLMETVQLQKVDHETLLSEAMIADACEEMVALIPELMATNDPLAYAPDLTLPYEPPEPGEEDNKKPKKQDPTASVEVVPVDEGYAPTYSTAAAGDPAVPVAGTGSPSLSATAPEPGSHVTIVIPEVDPTTGECDLTPSDMSWAVDLLSSSGASSQLLPGIVPVRLVFTWVDRHGISHFTTRDQLVRLP